MDGDEAFPVALPVALVPDPAFGLTVVPVLVAAPVVPVPSETPTEAGEPGPVRTSPGPAFTPIVGLKVPAVGALVASDVVVEVCAREVNAPAVKRVAMRCDGFAFIHREIAAFHTVAGQECGEVRYRANGAEMDIFVAARAGSLYTRRMKYVIVTVLGLGCLLAFGACSNLPSGESADDTPVYGSSTPR